MDKSLVILCALAAVGLAFVDTPNGAIAACAVAGASIPAVLLIRRYSDDKLFLTNIFGVALLLRLGLGVVIHLFNLRDLFGPDAITYDAHGKRLIEIWLEGFLFNENFDFLTSGWGMSYLVGAIYFVFGESMLIAQSVFAVAGAATAPMVYFCAEKIFHNKRVAKRSALFIVFFPPFIIWSSQLLKDGLIVFLLVLVITMILQLQKTFSLQAIAALIFSLFAIISLRFYIFYMLLISIAGSFFVGSSASIQAIIRNVSAVILIGVGLAYLGISQEATESFEKYGSLESIQMRRQSLAKESESGFGEDIDVSTPTGAAAAFPIGFAYLMFSPFPWEATKLSQILVLPEVFVWWALIPILISGLSYTIKNHLRTAMPVLLFSLMLTIGYSLFQGNVGMAYRQRVQIQVFLFIFIAVGWTLIQERNENRRLLMQSEKGRGIRKAQARHIGT